MGDMGDMGERAVDEEVARLTDGLWEHGRKTPAMEESHEDRFHEVVAMVAEHNGRAAVRARDPAESAAPQLRAERTRPGPRAPCP